jgi:hypothetical protein
MRRARNSPRQLQFRSVHHRLRRTAQALLVQLEPIGAAALRLGTFGALDNLPRSYGSEGPWPFGDGYAWDELNSPGQAHRVCLSHAG